MQARIHFRIGVDKIEYSAEGFCLSSGRSLRPAPECTLGLEWRRLDSLPGSPGGSFWLPLAPNLVLLPGHPSPFALHPQGA